MNSNESNQTTDTNSVISLVFGIISIVLSWVPFLNFVSLILGIIGIILGIKGRKISPANKSGIATAGLICSIIGTVFSAIGFVGCTFFIGCPVCIGMLDELYYL